MRCTLCALVWILVSRSDVLVAQTREEKVRNDKAKVEARGYWIYNDVAQAFEQAAQTGKPIVVVLRCLPCEECVKLDDEIIDEHARLTPLLDQFVRVRVVSTNGLDLSLFQFDTDQSFAVFMLNADGVVYGRFGTRSHRTEWLGDVSVEGLAKALEGALALHREFPANRALLAGKRGPVPEFDRPEKLPPFKDRYKSRLDYQGQVVASCIHCHQIGDAQRDLILTRGQKLPDRVLFPFPHPRSIGLVLDPNERATLSRVEPESPASRSGFRAGDAILSLAGQPLLSMADVQWVLEQTPPEGASLPAEVVRADSTVQLDLVLPKGWRERDDISWRASTWELRRAALGGMYLVPASEAERSRLKVAPDQMALRVEHVGKYAPHDVAHRAGVRDGDMLVGCDSRTDFNRETDLIVHVLRTKRPGDRLALLLSRGNQNLTVAITIPNP